MSLEEIATCHVCMGLFNQPRRLPCPHSFCTNCIQGLLASTEGAPKLKCPECRQEHTVPLGGVDAYPIDVRLADLVQSIGRSKSQNSDDFYRDFEADGPASLPWEPVRVQSRPYGKSKPNPMKAKVNRLKERIRAIQTKNLTECKGKWIQAQIDLADIRCQIDEQFQLLAGLIEARRESLQFTLDPVQGEMQQNIATLDEIQDLDSFCGSLSSLVDRNSGEAEIDEIEKRLDDLDGILVRPIPKFKFLEGQEWKNVQELIQAIGQIEQL